MLAGSCRISVVSWDWALGGANLTTETAAILISLFSIVIAGVALGWNVYRDVILKPKLRVRFSVANVVTPGVGRDGTFLNITGTNFGPGELVVSMVCGRQ